MRIQFPLIFFARNNSSINPRAKRTRMSSFKRVETWFSRAKVEKDVVEKEEEDEAARKNERNNNPSRRSDHPRRHVLTNGIQN